MKINFDDIITKANARKDALTEFSNQVSQAHLLKRDIENLGLHLQALAASIKGLDPEARAMVGEYRLVPLQRLCENYSSMCANAKLSCGFGGETSWKILNDFAIEASRAEEGN